MRTAKRWLTGLFLLLTGAASGQCPVADFSVPAAACRSENLFATNLTPGTNSYYWDFCSGELASAPNASVVVSNGLFFRARSFRMVNDGGIWTGFVIDQVLNRLVRLDFGADPSATPNLVDLGNPGGALNGAFDFQLLRESGNWYAVVVNSGNNTLVSLHFGTTLQTLSPTIQHFGTLGVLNVPNGIKLIQDAGTLTGFVSNGGAAEMVRLDFGASVTNPPATTVIPVAGAAGLRGIDLVRECNRWFGLVTSYDNGKVFWLDFDNGLQQPPQTGAIGFFTSYLFPASLALAWDGDVYYAFIQSALGSLYRLDFGTSIIDKNGAGADLGNLGISNENFALSLQRSGTTWHGFSVDLNQQRLVRLAFPETCLSSVGGVAGSPPPSVTYQTPGVQRITLEVVSATGATDAVSKTVSVSASFAPDVDFSITNSCRDHDVLFTSVNASGGIIGYLWDFGDASSSGLQHPTHPYSASGPKTIELRLEASNGCFNRQRKTLEVVDPPAADFTLPAITPVCTNQAYAFTNTSVTDPESSPLWEWRLNGVLISGQQDLQTTFTTATAKEIRLKALIPGCENEMIKNMATVFTGPLVDFSAGDDCAGSLVTFTNATTGADAGYSWDFGDGSPPSTLAQPTHTYGNAGTFQVTLTGSNAAGCNNFTAKSITIYSVPQPDFSVGLPPFSCSNSPTLFQNDTPGLADSNISDWFWEFGDAASSTSSNRDPTFVYTSGGSYSVTLTATSDAGCSNIVTKSVGIGTSPVANFANGPACVNQATLFTDLSSGGVQSRTWQIGGSFFGGSNPTYTFAAPGNYNVTLTVTGSGGCNNAITKPVFVPVVPVLAMQVDNPCVDQQSVFTLMDNSPPVQDDVIGWQWNIAGSATNGNPATGMVAVAGTSPVSVTTTHASGCVYTQTSNVVFHPSPVANFTALPDRGNAPLTVQFQNLSTGASQYQWQFSGNPPGFSATESPVHTFLSLGDYTAQLTVVNAQGCSDSKSIPIRVLVPSIDLALTEFALLPDAASGKLRPRVTVKNNSNIPVADIEIAIHLSDLATVSESVAGANLQVGESISYLLALTVDPAAFAAPFVCAEVRAENDVVIADNRQCLNQAEGDFVFDPYPNPSSGLLYLDWVAEKSGFTWITVYNSQGRAEYTWQTPSATGLNQSVHDLSFLASGIYYVTVQTTTTTQTRRFVRP